MSASDSNLSSPKYGYDLVCATTQDAINATLKQYLSTFSGTAFTSCYTYDPVSKKNVETPLAQIQQQIGGDPFSIPDGADGSNPLVAALYNTSKFVYAFRATLGLPPNIPPAQVPDIVAFNQGNSLVSYQLYCATFEVIVLNNNFGTLAFQHLTQSPTDPWIFLFSVDVSLRGTTFDNLPAPIQQNLKNLNPGTMFSVQQLYLDLNTAGLQKLPVIEKLDPTSDAYIDLTKVFINQYWVSVNQGGQGVILGYQAQPAGGTASTSITPTDLSIEVSPNLDSGGNPTGDYGLYTLNYLVMTDNAKMPSPVPFGWNWVEASEESDFHGVIAVRAPIFISYLNDLMTPGLQPLNYVSVVSLTHSGLDYTVSYQFNPASTPLAFTIVPTPTADPDGYTRVLTIDYSTPSHDDSEDSLHTSSIHGDYNYSVQGDVAIGGSNIRVRLHVVLYVQFNVHELGIVYTKVDQNGIDYQIDAVYQMVVTPDGQLTVVPTYNDVDNAQPMSWDGGGLVDTSDVRDYVEQCISNIKPYVQSAMHDYEANIAAMINGSSAWVYPGGTTFAFKQAGFSTYNDLLARITYADPTFLARPAKELAHAR